MKNLPKSFSELWNSSFYKRAYNKHRLNLPSHLEELFDKVYKFGDDDFDPKAEHVLVSHQPSSGKIECEVDLEKEQLRFSLIDVGGSKNQVKKWTTIWEEEKLKIDVIVFMVALDECFIKREPDGPNGLDESLQLWGNITSLPKLAGIPFILLLNKNDRFPYALQRPDVPKVAFNDYFEYIIKQFRDNFGGCVMWEYAISAIKVEEVREKFVQFLKFF